MRHSADLPKAEGTLEFAWDPVVGHRRAARMPKPRTVGLTMVIDSGVGMQQLRDILELAGHAVDHWKFGFGTSALMTKEMLQKKLSLLSRHGVLAYPGGTLLEVALLDGRGRDFMSHAKALGFSAVEVSDGSIALPATTRRDLIARAIDTGLTVITEVGRKDPTQQPNQEQLADQVLEDLRHGANWVIMEGRDSGVSVGIYDEQGLVDDAKLREVQRLLGAMSNKLIWEAPQKCQQAHLIRRLGINVGLGNIAPDQILALEALRCRLRFDTLMQSSEQSWPDLRSAFGLPAPGADASPAALHVE